MAAEAGTVIRDTAGAVERGIGDTSPMRPTSRRRAPRIVAVLIAAPLVAAWAVPPAAANPIEVSYGDVRLQDSTAVRAVARAVPRSTPVAAAASVDTEYIRSYLGGRADFYRLAILEDGFPARKVAGTPIAQPIYGTYVLRGYLSRYADEPTDEIAGQMLAFARVVVARMEPYYGALVFRNPPELGFDRSPGRRYSGLTMGYYALYLAAIAEITADPEMHRASEAAFRSLLLPESLGGVLYQLPKGKFAVAEVPGRPADLTLNGWLSILVSIHDYAQIDGSEEASALFRNSAGALATLLPTYDIRDRHVSRYALSGPIRARLVVSDPAAVTLVDPRVDIPGDRSYPVDLGGETRWENHIAGTDAVTVGESPYLEVGPIRREVGLSLVLSRISAPRENAFTALVRTTRRVTITLETRSGVYDPRYSSPRDLAWRRAARVTIEPGERPIRLAIPWALADHVGGITHFAHVMLGKNVNIYHLIHIRRLEEMYDMFAVSRFKSYAALWRKDICTWGDDPRYAGLYVTGESGTLVTPRQLCASTPVE